MSVLYFVKSWFYSYIFKFENCPSLELVMIEEEIWISDRVDNFCISCYFVLVCFIRVGCVLSV